jgi:hypothetical protein
MKQTQELNALESHYNYAEGVMQKEVKIYPGK